MFGTGINDVGQLGVGDFGDREIPMKVEFEGSVEVGHLSVGDLHTVALAFG